MNPRGSERPASSPASLRATLAEIDAELAALRARIEELAAARKPIVDTLKSIIYPILTIPVEITAEIFLQCVDWAEISDKGLDVCAPFRLASVCKQWRTVALDLQPIWSRLQIFKLPFRHASKFEALLGWWAPRTGGRLLEVDMTASDSRAIAALFAHSTQWKNLIYDFSQWLRYPTNWTTIQGRLPRLEKLRIKLAWDEIPTEILSIFSDAPLLREVHITGLAFDPFVLPWGQLTTLGLAGQFSVTYTEILQRTPQLQILHLELGGEVFVAQTPLTLHHLHTLKLHGDRDVQEDAFLDVLTLPALRHLDFGVFPEEFEAEVVVDLLTRSSCSVASISFRSPSPHLPSTILRVAHTLGEVHLIDLDWTHAEFDHFFFRMQRTADLLPNLRKLSMSSRLVDAPYAAIARMVASRQRLEEGRARLESFQFTLPQLTPIDDDSEEFAMVDNVSAPGCRVEIQGLKGLKLNLGSNATAVHSYTLEPSYQTV